MQCPFLFKTKYPYCKTGLFGLMVPETLEYKKHCCNSSYYQCQVYKANTGVGDAEKCRQKIECRLIKGNLADQPSTADAATF